MTDKDIVKLINSLDLGMPCDFGYDKTADDGIWVRYTDNQGASRHHNGELLQVIVCLSATKDAYLKGRELTDKITEVLRSTDGITAVSSSYAGTYENKSSYSINFTVGGI